MRSDAVDVEVFAVDVKYEQDVRRKVTFFVSGIVPDKPVPVEAGRHRLPGCQAVQRFGELWRDGNDIYGFLVPLEAGGFLYDQRHLFA